MGEQQEEKSGACFSTKRARKEQAENRDRREQKDTMAGEKETRGVLCEREAESRGGWRVFVTRDKRVGERAKRTNCSRKVSTSRRRRAQDGTLEEHEQEKTSQDGTLET